MHKDKFIEALAERFRAGTISVFIGAGLSRPAMYPDWAGLLKDIAQEIGLDASREDDLPGLAQFYLNHKSNARTRITELIVKEFPENRGIPRSFRILARLPIPELWSTNYDTLPERAWAEAKKQMEVRPNQASLTRPHAGAHTVFYKMHGTVREPEGIVLAKEDYELYRARRPGFIPLLTSRLTTTSMLFLGVGFRDPNLSHVFAAIREANPDRNHQSHFTILRRPPKPQGGGRKDREKHEYDTKRHEHLVRDLARYSIEVLEIDRFDEIEEVLAAVERRLFLESVLVSGSFPLHDTEPGDPLRRKLLVETSTELGRLLASSGKRIVSGFGLTVGAALLSGALEELYAAGSPNLDRSLLLRPFPQSGPNLADLQARYREDMLAQAGIVVFVGGEKDDEAMGGGSRRITANGVISEFEAAAASGRHVVPLGATGGAAAQIADRIADDYDRYMGALPRALFDALRATDASGRQLAKAAMTVVDWYSSRGS
ncbi:SIR2 family protein [Indioceanicola profundi]|uniref:SIR2 family protein n=1 Tax=Indioceanicola profundi TaxID=2220096 RepID=UPI000E6ABA00|nr:SIR2 family protein [Indioceanicola profundi]